MRSTDDKAYVRPGTSKGFEKSRNVRILTLTDIIRARTLPKYHWPEKLVYITPAAHRIFTKKGSIKDDEETLKTDEDHHFVYVRPKATIGSSGSVWASEIVDLRHRSPDVFEMPTSNEQHLHRSISRFLCTCSWLPVSIYGYERCSGYEQSNHKVRVPSPFVWSQPCWSFTEGPQKSLRNVWHGYVTDWCRENFNC